MFFVHMVCNVDTLLFQYCIFDERVDFYVDYIHFPTVFSKFGLRNIHHNGEPFAVTFMPKNTSCAVLEWQVLNHTIFFFHILGKFFFCHSFPSVSSVSFEFLTLTSTFSSTSVFSTAFSFTPSSAFAFFLLFIFSIRLTLFSLPVKSRLIFS